MPHDFGHYLKTWPDGAVWWLLIDATKLAAGFVRAKAQAKLEPSGLAQIAWQQKLLAKFVAGRASLGAPASVVHNGSRYVEAERFLVWLRRVIDHEQFDGLAFPRELALAVQSVNERERSKALPSDVVVSLVTTLEPWFAASRAGLPSEIWRQVEVEVFLSDWDKLSPDQRRSIAEQLDYQRDPSKAPERQYWWDYAVRKSAIESEIEKWLAADGQSVADLVAREQGLSALREQLAALNAAAERYERESKRKAEMSDRDANETEGEQKYLPYLRALAAWHDRLDATPEEVAAWVWAGPTAGGVAAYTNANELFPPPRFSYVDLYFSSPGEWDYIAPLMACWFSESDVAAFQPKHRYITGASLIQRWAGVTGIQVEAFVVAKVRESALLDVHPIANATQATEVGNTAYPPMHSALFDLASVARIEVAEFGWVKSAVTAFEQTVAGVTAEKITAAFRVQRDETANDKWWRERMADSKRNGLASCRVGPASVGRVKSLWRPDMIAGWLLDRAPRARGGISKGAIRRGLLEFADCKEAAELLFGEESEND